MKKLSFITIVKNREAYDGCLKSLAELNIPEGIEVDVISVMDAGDLAGGYNQGMKSSDAEYKIYLKDTTRITNRNFIFEFLQIFKEHQNVGAIGVNGIAKIQLYNDELCFQIASMPKDEIMTQEKVVCFQDDLLITSRDYEWKDDLFHDDGFLYMSQSLEIRKRGFECVSVQFEKWCSKLADFPSVQLGIRKKEQQLFIKEYQEYILLEKEKDEKKIAFIIYEPEELYFRYFMDGFKDIKIPAKYHTEIIRIGKVENLAAAYNEAIKKSDARYKVYINRAIALIHPYFMKKIMSVFEEDEKVGIVGLLGCILPTSGKAKESRRIYGRYDSYEGKEKMTCLYKNPLYYQKVNVLEEAFLATQVDIMWDEDVDESLLGAAACIRMKENGYGAVVMQQNTAWIYFRKKNSFEIEDNNKSVEDFLERYGKRIYPLVSILIPTYNSPEYFEEALKSAIAQEYKNIEIIIGDDSTNEETKNLMIPYLKKYDFIQYFFHGGPLGGNGIKNIYFLINHCAGTYVNYLLHDDLFYAGKISKMMDYCLIEPEVHMVASARDLIDGDSKKNRLFSPWVSSQDEIIKCQKIGEEILGHIENFLGELTTVLIKKNCLKYDRDYQVGMYCGIEDRAYGDIPTWLEIGRRGGKCVYMAESLSGFRYHAGQNTSKIEVMTKCFLEFYVLIMLSWLNNIYIYDYKKFILLCDKWNSMMYWQVEQRIKKNGEKIDGLIKDSACIIFIQKIGEAIKNKQYEDALHEGIEYVLSYTKNMRELLAVCEKDKYGKWKKKGSSGEENRNI